MRTVYVYVMDTMADWEVSYVMAELNSKRFFRSKDFDLEVKTVSYRKDPIHTMGGLSVLPDLTIDEVSVDKENSLILPGSDKWNEPDTMMILELAKKFHDEGALVAAICGATVALANIGLLDERKHTSNGVGFLDMFCPKYKGTSLYVDAPAVRDGNLVTAAGTGGLMMAKLILEYLNVFNEDTLEHWYNYFSTGNANEFFAMMQSLN